MSNRKYGRILSRFEHPCSTSPPSTLWRIFTKIDPADHSVLQHLQRVHTRTLRPASLSLVPARTTHASILACLGHTSYNSSNHTSEHLVITSLDHHKTLFTEATASTTPHNIRMKSCDHFLGSQKQLSQESSYRMDLAMESASWCEKNKIELWWKTQEISFEKHS